MSIDERFARITEGEQDLEAALDVGMVGYWTWDVEKNVMRWDRRMHGLFGTSPTDCRPSFDSFLSLLDPDMAPAVERAIKHCAETEEPFRYTCRLKTGRSIQAFGTIRHTTAGTRRMVGVCLLNNDAVFAVANPARILIVEDSPTKQLVIRKMMEPLEARFARTEIEVCAKIEDAFEQIWRHCSTHFFCAVFDLNLEDSFAADTLKVLPMLVNRCPIVVISALTEGFIHDLMPPGIELAPSSIVGGNTEINAPRLMEIVLTARRVWLERTNPFCLHANDCVV